MCDIAGGVKVTQALRLDGCRSRLHGKKYDTFWPPEKNGSPHLCCRVANPGVVPTLPVDGEKGLIVVDVGPRGGLHKIHPVTIRKKQKPTDFIG